jgi:hypothetical protein
LDIALLVDKSDLIDGDMFLAQRTFAENFANEFTISTSDTQFAFIEYADTPTTLLGINAGTTATNVISKISSQFCKLRGQVCGSAPPDIASAIYAAVNELKSSSRNKAVTSAIVIVSAGWDYTSSTITSKIATAVQEAKNNGIAVFLVLHSTTISDKQIQAFGSEDFIIRRVDANELSGVDPDDLASKLCKLNTLPCGSLCCGVCDTACGICLPVDNCVDDSSHCAFETVLSGTCCVTRPKADPCTADPNTCTTSSCNKDTGICSVESTCQAPANDNCFNYDCVEGKCVQTLKTPSTKCSIVDCVFNQLTFTALDCGQSSSPCLTTRCDEVEGCIVEAVSPAPSECTVGCIDDSECVPPNNCYASQCNIDTCVFSNLCHDKDPCTLDICVDGNCQYIEMDCNDQDRCTNDFCIDGACATTPVVCDDSIDCTVDTCGFYGCEFTPSNELCQTSDPCLTPRCDIESKGCVNDPTTCDDLGLYCTSSVCVAFQGCVDESRQCSGDNSTESCVYHSCDEDNRQCTEEQLTCGAAIDTSLVVGTVLGTAAIAGIAVAAVVVVAGVGGGTAVAVAQAGAGAGGSIIENNPIFMGNGNSAANPIHRV